jgi:hypothetical protein
MTKPSTILKCLPPLIIMAASALGAWEAVKAPVNGDIWDLDFVNANSGWAGADRAILRYQNGTWSVNKEFPVNYGVGAISAYDDNCAWAAVSGWYMPTTMYYWDGLSWTPKDVIEDGFRALAICAKDEGWACSPTKVYHWDGSRWRAEGPESTGGGFHDLDFYDRNYGFLVGSHRVNYRYAGGNWHPIAVPDYESFLGVSVLAADEMWAAGTKYDPWMGPYLGKIGHYRGGSWKIYNLHEIKRFNAISMADNEFGWAVAMDQNWASNVIYRWEGTKWHRVVCPARCEIWDVETLSRDEAWACGSDGWFLRYRTGPAVTPSSLGRIKAIFK